MHVQSASGHSIGNTKVDQNNLSIKFANFGQKSGKLVSDFKRRMTNLLDSFDAIKMELPNDEVLHTPLYFTLL